jgi:hypothetical protein
LHIQFLSENLKERLADTPRCKWEDDNNGCNKKYIVHVSNRFISLMIDSVVGFYEHCNGPSGRIKDGKFLNHTSDCRRVKDDSAA